MTMKASVTAASCYHFSWRNTLIEVEVNDPIEWHIYKPVADLYCHVSPVHDADTYYQRNGVQFTTLSTVTTSRIGVYHVYFEAKTSKFNVSSIQRITFFVNDTTPPTFERVPTFVIDHGSPLPDLKQGLIYHDNHDRFAELILTIDSSFVQPHLGVYPIFYTLTDRSNNRVTAESSIKIVDTTPPVLINESDVLINIGDASHDFSQHFRIIDSVDKEDIEVIFDDSEIDYYHFGSYPLTVHASDQSNNTLSKTFMAIVTDTQAPTIELALDKIEIEPFEVYPFFELIDHVSDNVSDVTRADVIINTSELDISKIGSYRVLYELSDAHGNRSEAYVIVWVRPANMPVIVAQNQTTLVNKPFNPFEHIQAFAYDDVDITHLIQLIENGVKTGVPGIYNVTYAVFDQSGNYAQKTITVEVIDPSANKIPFDNTLVIIQYVSYLGFVLMVAFALYQRQKKKQSKNRSTSHTYL